MRADMTKEEAIGYVNTQLDKAVDDADFMDDEMYEALQVIVKIAEQEPCEDTISRQVVLKEIPALWNSNGDKDYCMETLRDFVAELPPVTPTRKKGRWINERKSVSTIGVRYCNCSKCGYVLRDSWGVAKNFCPNCDADMRGGEE
jgi:hypothetical protein